MANESPEAGFPAPSFDSGTSPTVGDVPQFLYDRGFAGILAAAARQLRESIATGTESVGLPPWGPGRVALMSRLLDGPLSQVEIAKFLKISPPSAMQLVKKLEDDGFVERQRDPNDRRRVVVSLTPPTCERVIAMRRRLVDQMTFCEAKLAEQGFTQADIDRCKALLRAFMEVDRAQFLSRTPGARNAQKAARQVSA